MKRGLQIMNGISLHSDLPSHYRGLTLGGRHHKIWDLETPPWPRSLSNNLQQRSNYSENKEFSILCKALFRSLQLEYHKEKWHTTPRDIEKQFTDVLDKITPPQPTPELRSDIQAIIKKASNLIKERVQTHLLQKMDDNNNVLMKLNQTDLNKAGDIVYQQVKQRFPHKIHNIKDKISKYKGMVGSAFTNVTEDISEVHNPLPIGSKESDIQFSQHMVANEGVSILPENSHAVGTRNLTQFQTPNHTSQSNVDLATSASVSPHLVGNMEIPFIGTHKILPVNSDSISLPQRYTMTSMN